MSLPQVSSEISSLGLVGCWTRYQVLKKNMQTNYSWFIGNV